jgi:hypothetical protein
MISRSGRLSNLSLFAILALLVSTTPAWAVPSYATQTGQPCATCHVGAFGPQLTPFGRNFKLNGYTQSDGGDHPLPVSLMLQTSFTSTQKSQTPSAGPGFGPNDNFSLDQISAFYAGAITPSIGAFVQTTYDGIANVFTWDNMDVRYAHSGSIMGTDYVAGVTLNNNPTVQDLWNSTPAWGFPFSASGVAPTPAASTLIDGGLAQAVLGGGAYASIDNWLYLEGDIYKGLSRNIRNNLGTVPGADTEQFDGVIPYWRLALEHDFDGAHYVELGTYGLTADRFPAGDRTSGFKDHIVDNAVDANYQWHEDPDHFISAHATYIHETEDLNATFALGGSDNPSNRLDTFRTDVSYSYKNTYTPSVQYFNTRGTTDATFWGTDSGSPNTEGFIAELAYVPFGKPDSPLPWVNGRLALQYVAYTQFNGTSSHASDNNTIFLNLWLSLDPLAPLFDHGSTAEKGTE